MSRGVIHSAEVQFYIVDQNKPAITDQAIDQGPTHWSYKLFQVKGDSGFLVVSAVEALPPMQDGMTGGLTFAGFNLAGGAGCASCRSRCSPPNQGQPVWPVHQWAAAHRQGGGHRFRGQLGGDQSVLAVVVITTGGCRAPSPPCVSHPRA
jgi:hypothetical protein